MSVLNYESPLPIYAIDWAKTPGTSSSSHLPRAAYRLALGTFTDDFRNRISIIGLPDERALHDPPPEDLYAGSTASSSDFVLLADALHGYPVTKIAWEPSNTFREPWKDLNRELLTTTGDALRIWEYSTNEDKSSAYVGRHAAGSAGKLTQRIALSSSKNPNPTTAPLTSFSWNALSPNLVVTSSIDTTCTVWDLSASTAVTQLIAHDREVYDVAWAPGSVDSFVSVGADGSLRAFDLRSLEHSTILYETPSKPKTSATSTPGGRVNSNSSTPSGPPGPSASLLRIAFNPLDANFLATFHSDSPDVQILDMRSPGRPVVELKAHRGAVSAVGWGSQESGMVASAGDDCQLLVWDLTSGYLAPRSSNSHGRSPHPESQLQPTRAATDPVLAYSSNTEISNLVWSPPILGDGYGKGSTPQGEWIAFTAGKSVKALKV